MKKRVIVIFDTLVGQDGAVNRVLSAVCGCGRSGETDYTFFRNAAKILPAKNNTSFMAPKTSCDCGGYVEKKHRVSRHLETHCAKPFRQSRRRQTVRGIMKAVV